MERSFIVAFQYRRHIENILIEKTKAKCGSALNQDLISWF
jgi:hypothetical protein